MNKSKIKRLVCIILLIIISIISGVLLKAPEDRKFYILKVDPIKWSKIQQDSVIWVRSYEEMIASLKETEGYRPYPYNDARVKSVGYGHVIKKTDRFAYPMSKEFADSLLKADFNAAMTHVREETTLKGNQLLAISHFVFCLGKGNFDRSNLKRQILRKKPIDYEITKWTKVYTSKGIIHSSFLKKLRRMELELYKTKV